MNTVSLIFEQQKIKFLADYYSGDLKKIKRFLPENDEPYIAENREDWERLNTLYSDFFTGEKSGPDLEINMVSDESGWGVFSVNPIKEGLFVRLYTGKIRPVRRLFPLNHDYCLEYPPMSGGKSLFEIDALKEGNESRFFNHDFDGNLLLEHSFYHHQWYVFFIANRNIDAGEQLCFDYGEDYWAATGKEIEFYR